MASTTEYLKLQVEAVDPSGTISRLQTQIDRLNKATRSVGPAGQKAAQGTAAAAKQGRVFARNFQNASYQIQDFVVQVGGGVSVTRAFSQQAPQLLSAFGAIGAGIGVAAALLPTLIQLFIGATNTSKEYGKALSELEESTSKFGEAAELVRTPLKELEKTYGSFAKEVRSAAAAVLESRLAEALEKQKYLADGLLDTYASSFGASERLLDEITKVSRRGDRSALKGMEDVYKAYIRFRDSNRENRLQAAADLKATIKAASEMGVVLGESTLSFLKASSEVNLELLRNKGKADAYQNDTKKQIEEQEKAAKELAKIRDAEFAQDEKILATAEKRRAALEKQGDAVRASLDPFSKYFETEKMLLTLKNEMIISEETFAEALQKSFDALDSDSLDKAAGSFAHMQQGLESLANQGVDQLVDGLMEANLNMRDLTQTFIRGAIQMALQLTILNALAATWNALTGGSAAVVGGGLSFGAAKGAAFDGSGTQFFAQGGVVNRTTAFGIAGGGTGVMGESGPEAILPLSRQTSTGELGVKAEVSVNVVNSVGNAAVDVRQEGNQIQIMINDVADNIRSGGIVGRAIEAAYRMPRRGGSI